MHHNALTLAVALAAVSLSACAQDATLPAAATAAPAPQAGPPAAGPVSVEVADPAAAAFAWPTMTVHKSPSCGCCVVWVEHMRGAGVPVEVVDTDDMGPIKQQLGVPYGKGSCHTAHIDGYLIEGHVPVADIRRLLQERPQARGLVLPGMPAGSPGMEMPDGRRQAFTVELVAADGSTSDWAHHPARDGNAR
ncbi:DUF411 domain-containing protein [Luteimonas yindakuii]|nr:DUF411 domain-containing protein [Luteimonas yindakuii]